MTFNPSNQPQYVKDLLSQGGISRTGDAGKAVTINFTYKLPNPATGLDVNNITTEKAVFTAAEYTKVQQVLGLWSNVANVTFKNSDANATLTIAKGALLGSSEQGVNFNQYDVATQKIVKSETYVKGYADYVPGSVGGFWLMHEIGHALGLSDAQGKPLVDSWDLSVMSYNPGDHTSAYNLPITPMIYDIAAIQYLYGANRNFNKTDTPYTLKGSEQTWTIWDAAGIDTLQVSANQRKAAVLDLRGGVDKDGKPYWSYVGDEYVAIAFDAESASGVVDIEKAIGGQGNDTIYGGMIDNDLRGGLGRDSIYGDDPLSTKKFGNDTIFGEAGNDTIHGLAGNDTIYGDDQATSRTVNVLTGIGNDTVYAGAGNDSVYGGWGNDRLYGDAGNDQLYDSFSYRDSVKLATATDNDRLYGGAGNDRIFINEGNDTVDGGAGTDTLTYLHSHGMAFEFSDDTASSTTSLVKAYDGFNIATGTITDTSTFDTIRNVENFKGTAYDDLYILDTFFGGKIEDSKGNDVYSVEWEGFSLQTTTTVIDGDGKFSLSYDGMPEMKGIMFTKYNSRAEDFDNYYDVWRENAAGVFEHSILKSSQVDRSSYLWYEDGWTSTLGFTLELGSLIYTGTWYSPSGDILPGGRTIDFKVNNMLTTDLFAAINSQQINFNVSTQMLEFNYG